MKNHQTPSRSRWIGALLAAACLLAGNPAWATKLSIVATTSTLASLAKSVAKDHATVISLAGGHEDPHYLQALPSYLVKARHADLWIKSGMDLEIGWEGPVLDGARNPKIRPDQVGYLDVSSQVIKLDVPRGKISREMGDVHPAGNPHWWLDPLNGRIAAEVIAKRLARLDPAHTADYQANLAEFRLALDRAMFGKRVVDAVDGATLWTMLLRGQLEQGLAGHGLQGKPEGWYGRLMPFRGQALVTYHRSWVYFCNRFALRVAVELEPKPGVPPSGRHLNEVIALVKRLNIKLILMEPFYSPKAAELVAAKTGAQVVRVANSVGGSPAARDYLSLMELIVNRVAATLE